MGEMFDELADSLAKNELKDRITLTFVDVLEDSLDGHEIVRKVLDKGIALPVTAINGKPLFYGGLSPELILEEIRKL